MKYFLHDNDLPREVNIGKSIAIDTETTGLNLIRDRLCLIQICNEDKEIHLIKINKNSASPVISDILSNEKILKIFHFARFDLAVLMKMINCNISNVYCTKIASKLARTSTDNHSLKSLVLNYLSIEIPKFEQTSDWGALNLTKSQLDYAASDVLYLHQLKHILDEILIRESRDKLAKDIFQFLPKLSFLDLEGWDVNSLLSHK
ncbi:MAG: ribonuclease D [Paracoccaceae bacterium]